MLTTSRAIVLNTTKYGDKRLLISMFTKKYGIMSFSYNVVNRKSKANKVNYFQPLTLLDLEFDMKPVAKIQQLSNASIAFSPTTIPSDPYKLPISIFIADFLRFAISHEQQNEPLFDYITASVHWLDKAKKHYSNFHIIFMVEISKLMGIYPNLDNYLPEVWFDFNESCFVNTPSQNNLTISPREAALIPTLSRLSFRTMHLLQLSHNNRNYITEMILKYYSLHIPAFPELRSFAILKDLFA